MQQIQSDLIEKQVKQHTNFEQQRSEDEKLQEKLLKEKIDEYEKRIQIMKSIFYY